MPSENLKLWRLRIAISISVLTALALLVYVILGSIYILNTRIDFDKFWHLKDFYLWLAVFLNITAGIAYAISLYHYFFIKKKCVSERNGDPLA